MLLLHLDRRCMQVHLHAASQIRTPAELQPATCTSAGFSMHACGQHHLQLCACRRTYTHAFKPYLQSCMHSCTGCQGLETPFWRTEWQIAVSPSPQPGHIQQQFPSARRGLQRIPGICFYWVSAPPPPCPWQRATPGAVLRFAPDSVGQTGAVCGWWTFSLHVCCFQPPYLWWRLQEQVDRLLSQLCMSCTS